ncbi:MAG: hypothetical protein ABJ308_10415 [Halieaceae bacterium]
MPDAQHPPVICILGMHRSGTSCLTGSLQQLGLVLGKHHTWNRFNQKGNRENQDIIALHDQLLAASEGAWDKPPGALKWDSAQELQARQLIDSFPAGKTWGFKDPRSLLLLEFWDAQIDTLGHVGVFRHPLAVARSLQRRAAGQIEDARAIELWCLYNERLLARYESAKFPLLSFDWDRERFQQGVIDAAAAIGLDTRPPQSAFYDSSLIHFQSKETAKLPRRAAALYDKLCAASDAR